MRTRTFAPIFAAIASLALVPYAASAAGSGVVTGTTLINPLGDKVTLFDLLDKILQFVTYIGSIVVVLMVVYVGYKFVIARGEPGKITEARKMLLWTIIGALVLLGAQAIALGIQATVQAISVGS